MFNFLVKDRENLNDVLNAGKGYIIPGLTAADHEIEQAIEKVKRFKELISIVSVSLGGNGDVNNWKKALEIAIRSDAGHLNQPFETASFAYGHMAAMKRNDHWINALVAPSGEVGKVKLTSGSVIATEIFVDLVVAMGIPSIKMMPMGGLDHLQELVDLTNIAVRKGVRAIEPAGGIHAGNIGEIVDSVRDCDIEVFIPHIFGSVIDKQTGKTEPVKVSEILHKAGG